MATFFTQRDPNAVLDYSIDWTEWLSGDAISTSSWIIPTGLSTTASSFGTATTIVWISGGTAGEIYDVTNRIVTTGGRTEDRTIEFTCLNR